ncbi:MAG TPA: tetratricopeptide repeat protein, partial [Phycisphaerae bacterium]|nr:tetratricopeptide repeat protein [Phycisphaerae bacterium]
MQDANIQRAQLLYQQQRYDMAADALRQALGQMPQDAYAHSLLGMCLMHQEKFEEATAEAQKAIGLAPDSAFGHYALGLVYRNRNRFPEAEVEVRRALQLAPADSDFWCLLAEVLFARQQWEPTLDAANTGLQFDPEHSGCLNMRAMALVKLGDKMAAAQTVMEDLRRNPHNALSHANQGWTLLHQNNHKQALEHFREALRLDPNNEWAQHGMMQALKARYFLYRMMLRYYLWMSRFTSKAQWGIIIGLWVGAQILRTINNSYPDAAPFIYPVL